MQYQNTQTYRILTLTHRPSCLIRYKSSWGLCDHTLETMESAKILHKPARIRTMLFTAEKRLAEDMFDVAEPVSCVLADSQIALLLNRKPN